MSTQTLTLDVPDALLARIQARARQANRTVEAELLDVLAAAVPLDGELPADLAEAVAALDLLDDAALWRAARSGLAAEASAELEALHLKQRREGLIAAEEQIVRDRMRQYERAMLVRARAAALLHRRGHDVSGLVAP